MLLLILLHITFPVPSSEFWNIQSSNLHHASLLLALYLQLPLHESDMTHQSFSHLLLLLIMYCSILNRSALTLPVEVNIFFDSFFPSAPPISCILHVLLISHPLYIKTHKSGKTDAYFKKNIIFLKYY